MSVRLQCVFGSSTFSASGYGRSLIDADASPRKPNRFSCSVQPDLNFLDDSFATLDNAEPFDTPEPSPVSPLEV